jgi:DNA-binding beta-propeller fold protein YncE
MKRHRTLLVASTFVTVIVVLAAAQALLQRAAAQEGGVDAPRFEVDPFWPKPLPNNWILGQTIGVWVDEQDVVWIVHRSSATLADNEKALELKNGECCAGAPPVLAFDAGGNLVRRWGGPSGGSPWPQSNHGIFIDYAGNVWIGGNGAGDSQIVKYTKDGKFVAMYGKPNVRKGATDAEGLSTYAGNSNDPSNFGRVAKIFVDPRAKEAYIADGYLNKRVAVLDAETGRMKRHWGAFGNKPDDRNMGPYDPNGPSPQQFRNPVHCADLSNDNLVYVCDRVNDRLQVFKPDGSFVKEMFIAKNTKASGSVWDIAFSKDPQQKYIYVADGMNNRVYVLLRDTLQVLTSFGTGGRQAGQFFGVHSIATDSKGNVYTTETWEGKRLQKFVFRGVSRVRSPHQGVVWPGTK